MINKCFTDIRRTHRVLVLEEDSNTGFYNGIVVFNAEQPTRHYGEAGKARVLRFYAWSLYYHIEITYEEFVSAYKAVISKDIKDIEDVCR